MGMAKISSLVKDQMCCLCNFDLSKVIYAKKHFGIFFFLIEEFYDLCIIFHKENFLLHAEVLNPFRKLII